MSGANESQPLTSLELAGVFAITTAVLLTGALVVGVLGIDTSGKTLEEISASSR